MSDKKVLDLILNELKEIKTDVSELKTTVSRIDNNTADIRDNMDKGFENVHENLDQAFWKISENIEQKEKVDTIFNFLNKTQNKNKSSKISQYNRRESLIA